MSFPIVRTLSTAPVIRGVDVIAAENFFRRDHPSFEPRNHQRAEGTRTPVSGLAPMTRIELAPTARQAVAYTSLLHRLGVLYENRTRLDAESQPAAHTSMLTTPSEWRDSNSRSPVPQTGVITNFTTPC